MLLIQCFECYSDNADFPDADPNATEFNVLMYLYICRYSTGRGRLYIETQIKLRGINKSVHARTFVLLAISVTRDFC